MVKTRLRIIIFYTIICMLSLAAIAGFYLWRNAKDLPSLPDLVGANPYLKEQVISANKKAKKFPSAENIGKMGMVYNSAAFYNEAAQCYTVAASKDPHNWKWSYYLGFLNLELGHSESAIESFRSVLRRSPRAYMAMYYTGSAWQNLNVPDSAEKYFLKIGEADDSHFMDNMNYRTNFFPLPVYAKFSFASLCVNRNRYEIAENLFRQIITDNVTFGPAYKQLSNLFAMRGDSAMSHYYSSRANDLTIFSPPSDSLIDDLSLISRSDVFLMKQADIAIRSANSRWAVRLLQHGLVYLSDNKYFLSRAVKQFLSVGMGNAALPYVERHLSLFGDDSGELLETGKLLADAGLQQQAGKYFMKAFENNRNNAEVQSEISLLFVQKGMKEEGSDLIKGLLKTNSGNEKIIGDAAFLFLELNDKENTMKYFNILKRLSPNNVKLNILSAIIAEKEGKTAEASSLYEVAFSRDPKNIYVIDHLGNIYLREQQWRKAIGFFNKALVFYPNSSALQERLGSLLVACPDASIRNIAEGKEYCERAFINYNYTLPTRISAGRSLALAYYDQGDLKKARFYINSTVRIAENANVSKNYMQNLNSLLKEFSR